jgi:hypothetical protein
MTKGDFSPYAREQLGYYVYALKNPLNDEVFYIGKGVGNRVFDHAKGALEAIDNEESMRIQIIREILDDGRHVEAFILQHGLVDDSHAFQTESAVYGALKLLQGQRGRGLSNLANLIQPPTFEHFGLMSVEDVAARYGKQVDESLIPHNSIFVKPTELWHKGMSKDDLWEVTRGWWALSEKRLTSIRYVFSIPNFVIRAVWEVEPEDWREQGPGDRGWDDVLRRRKRGLEKRPRRGFESRRDLSDTRFTNLINGSVSHTFLDGQGKRANITYLDDPRIADLRRAKPPRKPFWNVELT